MHLHESYELPSFYYFTAIWNVKGYISLIPRLLCVGREKGAWYTCLVQSQKLDYCRDGLAILICSMQKF